MMEEEPTKTGYWNVLAGNIIARVMDALLNATPALKDFIKQELDVLEKKAAETPNSYDDKLVTALRTLLGM